MHNQIQLLRFLTYPSVLSLALAKTLTISKIFMSISLICFCYYFKSYIRIEHYFSYVQSLNAQKAQANLHVSS